MASGDVIAGAREQARCRLDRWPPDGMLVIDDRVVSQDWFPGWFKAQKRGHAARQRLPSTGRNVALNEIKLHPIFEDIDDANRPSRAGGYRRLR
jgi:hypothetical protein